MNNLDNILTELGQFGNYQIGMYFLFFLPLLIHCSGSMSYVFTTSDAGYRCFVPQCENNSQTYYQSWLYDALPFSEGGKAEQCLRYRVESNLSSICSKSIFSSEVEKCDRFVFETDENTMAKEFNLLCDENEWKRTLVGTLINVGLFIGMPLTSTFSDKFGRKTMLISCLLLSALLGTVRSFTKTFPQYVAIEVLDAITYSSVYSGIHVFAMEIIGPEMRGFGGALISIFCPLGEILLGIVAWCILDWQIYLRILYIPAFLFVSYIWILPESVRWLLVNGKNYEVTKAIECIAKWNGKKITDDMKTTMENLFSSEKNETTIDGNKENPSSSLSEIFKSRIMLVRIANCSFCWFTHTFVFYGLSLHSVTIAGNKYLNFILVSLAEIPGGLLSIWMVNYYGRRKSLFLGLIISGATCISFCFVPQYSINARQVLYFTGKLGITESFAALYILTSEIYPTDVRHSLLGFCSTMGRIGSMFAPQVPLITKYFDPLLIFGALSFIAGALTLSLPETRRCGMPETMKDAEGLGQK